MKRSLLSLYLLLLVFGIAEKVSAQTKITDFPTYVGNPAGGWVPIVINGINRKIDANLIGYNQIDSFTIGLGGSTDTFYLWKNGAISFYKLYPHSGGGGSGSVTQINMQVPGGFFVTPSSITDTGTFIITTSLNGVVHAAGGAFSGGQIFNADVHDVAFNKLTGLPTTKSGYGITDVMAYSDTSSLSNRINLSVKYTDTSGMLGGYLRKIDTSSLSNRINVSVKYTDTANMLSPYLHKTDTNSLSSRINLKVNYTDTGAMLAPYLHRADTNSLSNRINLSVKYTDTSNMLHPYLLSVDTISLNNRVALKVNYTDTSNMLLPYLRKSDTGAMLAPYLNGPDTLSLSNRINLSVKYTDTSGMLSKYLRKGDTANMLLPYLRANAASSLYYPLSSNPSSYYKPTDTSLTLATQYYVTQHGSIYTAGYGLGLNTGAFFVDTSSNKIATQYYVNTHQGITYSAGTGLTLTANTFKADTTLLATQYDNGLKLNKTDTSSMLSTYLRASVAASTYYPKTNPSGYLSTIDTGNISSFSVKVRSLFSVGTGLSYNAGTGIITNTITNNNQLTNGSGFITGINSSMITTALGYTPVNPSGTISQYVRGDGSFATFAFNNLNDVTVTSPSNNQMMRYNSSTSKWNNFTPTFYQPTDTLNTLATKTNIVKDTVIGFQIGDGGTYTPSNGTTTYTNPILQFAQLISVYKADTLLPTFSITGGTPYVSFNSTTGVITLHNTTFLNAQPVVVQYAFGNGSVSGGGGGGGGSVTTVFGRSGAVTAQASDYSSFYYATPTGTTSQYIRGDGSFAAFPTLATVATTGSYNDLTGKPVIPTNTNQLTNGSGFISGITGLMVTNALGYSPINPSGSSTQYIEGNGTFATTDTTMIPSFYTKVRSEFTAGTGISISNGVITNNVTSGLITSALGFTPANQSTTISVNGTTLDLSTNRSFTVNFSTLGDVNLTSLADGQLAKYSTSSGKWINFTPTYLTTVDTGNIANFYQKVRSLFSAGSGISISNGVITNTINNTNQLINGAGYLSSIDTGNIPNFYQKVRGLLSVAGGGLSFTNGIFTTDTSTTLATQYYVTQHILSGAITSISGTSNQITTSTTSGATTISLPSNVHIVNSMFIGGTGAIQWGDGGIGGAINGYLQAQSNGVFLISNNAANDFGRLEFGGPTASYPSIARNGAGIDVKLADNSGYTTVQASAFIKNGGTSSQYLMGDGSTTTLNAGNGIVVSGSIVKADTTTANTGLTTLYRDGLKVKYTDTSAMLSPYARKSFISGAAPITYSSSTGIVGADTSKGTTSLATYSQLQSSYDTIHVVPYTTTGITLLRFSNDSLRPKPIIAGTNITLTQNSDSTVTISSTASGSGTVTSVATGLGLSGGTITTSGTVIADTSYLMTKNSNQTSSGNKTFSGTINLTTGNTYALKPNIVAIDTTTGQLYHSSAQFVDTTSKINGSTVVWNTSAGNFKVQLPGFIGERTTVSDAAYSILSTDYLVSYTSLSTGRTTTLPTAVGVTGKVYIIKDESGNAGTDNITIATTSAQTIDGASTKTINTAYGVLRVYSNGSNWLTF